jgi:threonine dehydratase
MRRFRKITASYWEIAMKNRFGLSDIEAAAERLRGKTVRTPLLTSPRLSKEAGCNLFVKAESLQRTGAFKYRGALNKMLLMDEAARP